MTLGDYIKDKRATMQLSQPQLAEQIGIEQSYLSKLENDKSLPSNEVFRRLLTALNLPLAEFIAAFSAQEQQSLTAITDVELYLKQQNNKHQRYAGWLVLALSLVFAVGAVCFYAGFQALCFPAKLYQYESQGVVLPGESAFVFKDWDQNFPLSIGTGEEMQLAMQKKAEKEQQMYQRLAQLKEHSFEFKGQYYVSPVEGGSRTFMFSGDVSVNSVGNIVLQLLGLFLMVFSAALSLSRKALLRF